jgi:hypothetical protein
MDPEALFLLIPFSTILAGSGIKVTESIHTI